MILIGLLLGLGLAVSVIGYRQAELARISRGVTAMGEARDSGSRKARLQYPQIDLSRCLGCGTCVRACPEEGVLDIIHGQALVVHGARCVGHGKCAEECPTGAIAVTLGDLSNRSDIPVIDESFEVPEMPGLFLGGEVTGYALIRTAIGHGTAIADEVHKRTKSASRGEALDLCIVGAGPAGLACALKAKQHGLRFMGIEQESLGGTVAQYPRRKLVMTQPVELPLVGKLSATSYIKEDLMKLWLDLAEQHDLPIRTNTRLIGLSRNTQGNFVVQTDAGEIEAANVCLALGRRGSPRKLEVPGEELPKVAYSLIDAQSYSNRRILVVGGGDSAIEAALGLSEQPGNTVSLSYRRHAFFRLKARNVSRLEAAQKNQKLTVLYQSQVRSIAADSVNLELQHDGARFEHVLPNDDVFVLAGGIPPYALLEQCGVSFDHGPPNSSESLQSKGTGILKGLGAALLLALGALIWITIYSQYYTLGLEARPDSPLHSQLRSSGTAGLAFGVIATLCIVLNLAYLLRRNPSIPFTWGSLQLWMTSHAATGILALLLAILHSAMAPQSTVGGHSLLGLAFLVITGAIGRYFYSFIPRAANGRELAVDELRGELTALSADWDREHRSFGHVIRAQVDSIAFGERWKQSFFNRLRALISSHSSLRRSRIRLLQEGRAQGVPDDQLKRMLFLANRAQRSALMAAHYEDLRALLGSWRYFHRWIALLMVLLLACHIATAVQYAELFSATGKP